MTIQESTPHVTQNSVAGETPRAAARARKGVLAALIVGGLVVVIGTLGTNVKNNPKAKRQVQQFFEKHGVRSVVAGEGNIGCPHEEGPDFPTGGDCPFCPFWKGKQGSARTQ